MPCCFCRVLSAQGGEAPRRSVVAVQRFVAILLMVLTVVVRELVGVCVYFWGVLLASFERH